MDNVLHSKIEGTGTPILIFHGFLGMSDNWRTIGIRLSEAGYQVHLIDLRNHGKSFHSDVFNYDAMSQDVYNYCKHHHLEKVIILGHSMGGKVVMQFAVKHPEMTEKMIVADVAPKYYRPHHQDILAGLSAVDFSTKPGRSDVEEILKQYVPDMGTRQFLMKSLYWKESGQLAFRFNLNVFLNNTEEIGKPLREQAVFDKPVLFIRGGESRYILETDFDVIKQQFPYSEIKTIEGAGHWLHAEKPEEFYELVIDFLKNK